MKLLRSDVGFDRLSHQILRSLGLRRELSRTPVVRVAPELVEGWFLSLSKEVVAMKSLRRTLKNVFREIPGLEASMVIKPSDTFKKEKYDLLIVDEAHRLR